MARQKHKDTDRRHWLNSHYARFSPHTDYELANGLKFRATVGYDWLTDEVKQVKVIKTPDNQTLPTLAEMMTHFKSGDIELIDQTEAHEKSIRKPQNLRMNHCDEPKDLQALAVKAYDRIKNVKLHHKIKLMLAS